VGFASACLSLSDCILFAPFHPPRIGLSWGPKHESFLCCIFLCYLWGPGTEARKSKNTQKIQKIQKVKKSKRKQKEGKKQGRCPERRGLATNTVEQRRGLAINTVEQEKLFPLLSSSHHPIIPSPIQIAPSPPNPINRSPIYSRSRKGRQ
jgi:hypothetical protein